MATKFCRSSSSHNSGVYWVEFNLDVTFGRDTPVGISTANVNYPPVVHSDGQGSYSRISKDGSTYELVSGQQTLVVAGVDSTGGISSIVEGDVINLLIDLDASKVAYYINGVFQSEAPVPVGLDYHILMGLKQDCQVTVNLHQDVAFTHLPTDPCTDWDGNAIGAITAPSNTLSTGNY